MRDEIIEDGLYEVKMLVVPETIRIAAGANCIMKPLLTFISTRNLAAATSYTHTRLLCNF